MEKDFLEQKIFRNNLINTGPSVSIEQINIVLRDDFFGKDDLVAFYQTYNGGLFEPRLNLCIEEYLSNNVLTDNIEEEILISEMYFIPIIPGERHKFLKSIVRLRETKPHFFNNKKYATFSKLLVFVKTHFPFATNVAGHDFWIEIPSGKVKYIVYTEDNAIYDIIVIANCFSEFLENLRDASDQQTALRM